jgi:signal transduction histidine kinase
MVYAIVRDHNGWIDVESRAGKGTHFTIYFPVKDQGGAICLDNDPSY